MERSIASLISVAMLATVGAGCSASPPARYYVLDSTAIADGAPPTHAAVMVGPITVPASVDAPQFVVQVAPNQVELDEFNRWAAPLNDGIPRAVAGDLAVLLSSPDVTSVPMANFKPTYWVTIDVRRFDSLKDQAAVIDAVWVVRQVATGQIRSGRTVAHESTEGQGFEALAAAHSRALTRVSGDIAAAVRTEAERTP